MGVKVKDALKLLAEAVRGNRLDEDAFAEAIGEDDDKADELKAGGTA